MALASGPLCDHLGSTAITTNAGGARVTELRYYAYGGTRYDAGGQLTIYRYTGQRIETGTGLYDYGARWYDPVIGRFLAPDPIVPEPGNPQALNRYAYVLNNPIKYRDPSGHWVETAWDIFSIGLDLYTIRQEGLTWQNGLALAVDVTTAILPGVPAFAGVLMKGGKAAKVAVEAASHADEVADALRAAREAGEAAPQVVRQLYEKGMLSGIRRAGEWQDILQGVRKEAGLDVHHLIEQRFAKRLGLKESEVPAVVLERTFHQKEVTGRLFSGELGLPTGGSYSVQQIWDAYKRVYGSGRGGLNRPDWLEAIWPYFERLGVQR